MSFDGKTILITGAASGIGKAAAKLFHQQGAQLALVDTDRHALECIAEELAPNDALFFHEDVSIENNVMKFVNSVKEKYGKIDVFFNNAGIIGKFTKMIETSADAFDHVMNINVKGVFYGLKHVLPIMMNQKFGSIVNTSSIGGLNGVPGFSPYAASKHAIIGLTKTAALESVEYGVRVNAICPSPVNTPMIHSIDNMRMPGNPQKARENNVHRIPMKRYAEPNEIAELVLFLSSNQASFVTGSVYRIDGGMAAFS